VVSSHELVEKTAGLASRVDNLVIQHTGQECRELEFQQARLEKLTLVAITAALDESAKAYKDALAGLDGAIDAIGEGEERIERISRIIKLVARAADGVEGVLKKASGLPF
jgi:hypothetical protein